MLRGIDGLLIADTKGRVLSQSGWHNAWTVYTNAMERALNGNRRKRWYGLTDADKADPPPPWKDFTIEPYDLRHSFCTWCRDNGVDMHVLQIWMGHADTSMISKIYDHVSDERIQREVEKCSNRKK